jgi:hypothetical protein
MLERQKNDSYHELLPKLHQIENYFKSFLLKYSEKMTLYDNLAAALRVLSDFSDVFKAPSGIKEQQPE